MGGRLRCSWLAALLCSPALAQTPAPPSNVVAADHAKWDNGTRLDLSWTPSPDDANEGVAGYMIYIANAADGEFEWLARPAPGQDAYMAGDLSPNESYLFEISAVGPGGSESARVRVAEAVSPTRQPFDGYRTWFVLTVVIFCGSVVVFIFIARGGKPLKIRKIAGLEAVDEAVGRATEMGRSCLYIPGILDMNDIQTIAGINILARVSKTAANYDAKIEVPTSRSLVMTAAKETVHNSFLEAGRPDAYNDDKIYYVTDEQFGYVAYVQGMMVREKPAACFYMGAFFAESLILAETGNSIGASQVAGTAMPARLPFFVAACDYTLIGEEFFAASAYLTGTPEELGSLKGQDVGKIIVAGGIVSGVAAMTFATIMLNFSPGSPVGNAVNDIVMFFKDVMLT
jgi:hypothetical protein